MADGTVAAAADTAPRWTILGILAAGLAGLIVGALGALILRSRAARAPRVTLSG
ncbi:MAG TPA: hypothetical protein VHJ79_14015 [Mycobacterium sp.]|nr:hypothetical protein [Mycobacterium sp.]